MPTHSILHHFNALSRPLYTLIISSSSTAARRYLSNCSTLPSSTLLCLCSLSASHSSPPPAIVEQFGKEAIDSPTMKVLKERMELFGIICDEHCTPGRYYCLFCPKCKGGHSMERSLSFHIVQNGDFAMWRCFHSECGWAGQTFADCELTSNEFSKNVNVKSPGQLTEQSLNLEPLSDKLVSFFGERMISHETLKRNDVMQVAGSQDIIAFTYRQQGLIVGCKYRKVEKRFWQEKGTEKMLYGLDDIKDADEIIIVEGEIDKLSVEEAGFRNCVSVPGGAPNKVSAKTLPSMEKDTAYKYIWSCRDYLDKASRIILATDSDEPGQALAEELARRLGKDRCWRVQWPKKDEFGRFKDANEVLKYMGSVALKKAIENAKLYHTHLEDEENREKP